MSPDSGSSTSFHEGWNEIHPVKVCTPLGTWNGAWPTDIGDRKERADRGFKDANDPGTKASQNDHKWRWTVHPYIDGCGDYPPLCAPSGTTRDPIYTKEADCNCSWWC